MALIIGRPDRHDHPEVILSGLLWDEILERLTGDDEPMWMDSQWAVWGRHDDHLP